MDAVDRNIAGIDAERGGDTAEAIRLYELNVAERFDGSHPYDRLRIIYSGSGRYADAIRVCRRYIDQGQDDPRLKGRYLDFIEKYKERMADA